MARVGRRRIGAIVVALLAASSCASSGSSSDVRIETASTDTADVESAENPETADDRLTEIVTEFVGDAAGGAEVLLDWDGTRRHTAAGTATDDGDALTPGRAFRVGSISKTFVAVLVLQLVDEGSVDLDAPLRDHLPDVAVGGDTTIRQLLSHQSGIPSYTERPAFFPDVLGDRSRRFTPAEIVTYVEDEPTGQVDQFAYSNTNYILLGQLVESVDGTDLNTSLRERITEPAGLDDTVFDTGDTSLPSDLVGGWSAAGDAGDPDAPYASIASSAWSAGSLVSTASDLAAFLAALTSDELISAESYALMTDTAPSGYGFGIFEVGFSLAKSGYGHNGSIPGFTSTMAIDPSTGDTLVVLTNDDALVADELAVEILTAPEL